MKRIATRILLLVVAALLLSRLPGIFVLPLSDTTEARYAEIARLMMITGDWITPWFKPDVVFWGKPPLLFWLQALFMHGLGVNEFAARLPSWLAVIATTALIAHHGRRVYGVRVGLWSALCWVSMGLTYLVAGLVLIDPLLVLATTLSLTAFARIIAARSARSEPCLVFIGLALGLLAKGPVAVVLVGLPVFLWTLLGGHWRRLWRALPWWRGSLLTLALAAPWYLAAEWKTPGFLEYFLVGEHIKRFLVPEWQGDLYGNAHDEPLGMIWRFWVEMALPWSLAVLAAVLIWIGIRLRRGYPVKPRLNELTRFEVLASLTPMLFFTMSSNVLPTYVLPALPFAALLLGRTVVGLESGHRPGWSRAALGLTFVIPVLTGGVTAYLALKPDILRTEAGLVEYYQRHPGPRQSELLYLDSLPFSARFYTREEASLITEDTLRDLLAERTHTPVFVAIDHDRLDPLRGWFERPVAVEYRNRRHLLVRIDPVERSHESPSPRS